MVKYLSSYIFEIRNRDIVPCATENIAVVDDNDSRILKFKIPAVIDDVDITDKILAIRYVNALGQFDTFFSDTREIKTDGDKRYIIFPWYLSQKATAASGTLTYDISVYDGHITDAAEEGQYILHTKPQVLNIEKGLLDVGSASQNPDVWTDAIATFQKIIGSYSNDAMNAAEAAKKSEDKANAYKDAAAVSASNAAASEAKAKQSEQNAATSETNAAESANKAKASQTASATSETNAKTSEQNAKASENASKASADDSASSASDSANSAQASLNSQNAAKTSETKALASEKAAKQSETNAATSVQNASNYADNSQQSANDAAASAAAALVSQNAAKASEDKAKISETNAKTSETNVANALVGTLKLSGGTMTGDITMSGDAKFVGNLTGNAGTATSADSATNDSIGQQIDATYIKDLRPTGDKIIITKGNNETSTIDGAAPKGYILTETIPASTVTGQTWFHVGSISNTSDGDLIKIEINCPTIVSTENNSVAYSKNITLFIHDLAQTNDSDLSTAYIFSYIMYDDKLKSSDVDIENNSTKKEFFYLIPTSGGNGQSNAELWINTDSTFFNSIINVSIAKKDNWGYVLRYSTNAPSADQAITPYSKTSVVTDTNYATRTNAGIVQIGDNITVGNKGLISLIKDNVDGALGYEAAEKINLVSITIPTTGWNQDSNSAYPNYIDIVATGITGSDCVALVIAPDSNVVAKKCYFTSTESLPNYLRIRARNIPTEPIKAFYYIIREDILMSFGQTPIGGVMLPPATTTELGGIIVGEGLKVSDKGVLSSDVVIPEVDKLTAYPVGSIYQSINLVSPAKLFGGRWMQVATDRVLMGASDSHFGGTTVESGLPNITGSFVADVKHQYSNASGAFTDNGYNTSTGGSDSYSNVRKFSLDASRSNPIYGRSNTVQPPAYYVYSWLRLGNVVRVITDPENVIHLVKEADKVTGIADANGIFDAELPNSGEWTITVSRNGESKTKTFTINEYTQCNVRITTADVFGVVWDYSNSSTALTRLNRQSDPSGFVTVDVLTEPVAAVGTDFGSSPFDSHAPWSGMEEYNIVNNAVGPKYGGTGFSRTDNDTMVFIPEFYYKVVDDVTNKKRYFYISSRQISGFEKHPGSGRYVGKYNTASGYVSKTGLAPLTDITRATARTKSMAKGHGWYQYDYASWCAVILLYIVEYADWNSSSKIGTGAAKGVSGRTDSMTYHTGEASATSGVQYRHIENVFGNIETFVDGINFNGNNVYVCTNPDEYADNTYAGYTNVGTKTGSSGYIKALGFSETAPWAIYPIDVGGNDTTYITDYCWNASSGWHAMASQGANDAGILYLSLDKTSTTSNNTISTRLMFVPSKH